MEMNDEERITYKNIRRSGKWRREGGLDLIGDAPKKLKSLWSRWTLVSMSVRG